MSGISDIFSTVGSNAFQDNPVTTANEQVESANNGDSDSSSESSLDSPSSVTSLSPEAQALQSSDSGGLFGFINTLATPQADTEEAASEETVVEDGEELAEEDNNTSSSVAPINGQVDPVAFINNIQEQAREAISNFESARDRAERRAERESERILSPVEKEREERRSESVTARNQEFTAEQRQRLVNVALQSQSRNAGQLSNFLRNGLAIFNNNADR